MDRVVLPVTPDLLTLDELAANAAAWDRNAEFHRCASVQPKQQPGKRLYHRKRWDDAVRAAERWREWLSTAKLMQRARHGR